jgi:uncharacterized membrane protein
VQFVNQFSFLIFAVAVALVVLFLLVRGKGSRARQFAAVSILAAISGLFFVARPGRIDDASRQAEGALLASDRPAFVEIYSKF